MADTLTRYLKLKVAADLSADAKYNLQKIDGLGATTITDVLDNLQLRSRGNIVIEAESLDVGGAGSGGTISLGTASSKAAIEGYTTSFNLRSALSLLSSTNDNNKISLTVDSTHSGDATLSLIAAGNATLTVPATTGELTTNTVTQTLTNKSLSGLTNTFSNIGYSSLLLTGSIVNADISNSAAIVDTKLATISTAGKVSNSATTATSLGVSSTIVSRDGSGNFTANLITADLLGNATNITASSNSTLTTLSSLSLPGSQVSGNISGSAANVTGIVAVSNGGTGNDGSNKATALLDLLPPLTGESLSILRVNITENGIEWASGAGAGTVTNVSASSPLIITGDSTVNPTISIPAATSLVSGYLSNTDWSTFNTVTTKEPAITASGNAAQFWNGNKTFASVTKSDVGLGNVDNTSDANKPVSSATQTALNAKYDASNPSSYIDASGARSAVVVNSPTWAETTYSPSALAVANYITAQAGGAVSYTWSTGDGTTKSITHSLNKATVSVTVYDENGEDILVDTIDRTSNNAVSLTSSVAPTGNWTVVIRP